MSDNDEQGTGFSADYVKELRQENASWRQKVRDLEAQQTKHSVQVELLKKGINVNPSWVELQDGETPTAAVDRFIQEYPQFNTEPTTTQDKPRIPTTMSPNTTQTNNRGNPPLGSMGQEIDEIKKDPKARSSLRNHYRQLLAQSSNKTYEGD